MINTSFNHSRAARKHRHRCLRLGDQKTNLLNNEDSIYLPPPPHTHTPLNTQTHSRTHHTTNETKKNEKHEASPQNNN